MTFLYYFIEFTFIKKSTNSYTHPACEVLHKILAMLFLKVCLSIVTEIVSPPKTLNQFF